MLMLMTVPIISLWLQVAIFTELKKKKGKNEDVQPQLCLWLIMGLSHQWYRWSREQLEGRWSHILWLRPKR